MSYYIDADEISLDDLRKRIELTDLVPSRASLLDEITNKMKTLESHGIQTLAHLRTELKTPRRLDAVASATGIDPQYLILLRRETESYFPKPFTLKDFDWLPKEEISRLKKAEYAIPLGCTSDSQHREQGRVDQFDRCGC